MYSWVVAWGREGTRLAGKRSLFGPFTTSVRAQKFSDSMMGETEVHEFDTRNQSRATQLLKANDSMMGETEVHEFDTRNQSRATQLLKAKGVEVEIGKEGNWEEQSAFVRHPKKEVV